MLARRSNDLTQLDIYSIYRLFVTTAGVAHTSYVISSKKMNKNLPNPTKAIARTNTTKVISMARFLDI